jgi:N6-L-threonylcarbamoyladenine synthase
MLILGIETSCDETAASIIRVDPSADKNEIEIFSNIVSSQIKLHAKYGGVVPSLAAREHTKNLRSVLDSALRAALCKMEDVDLISVTAGPGLIPCLLIGTAFAKTLAYKYKKTIIGVNHIEGHILSNWLTPIGEISIFKFSILKEEGIGEKTFPILNLVVSGGHTSLILMNGFGKYKLVGETLDDAAGEAFDKIARILELGYPGGPQISVAAEKYQISNNKLQISLPRPMLNSKDFNFSFAGLKTAVLYQTRELLKNHKLDEIKSEMAHEAEESITDVLVTKTIKAALKYKVKTIMISGGVSANKKLREKMIEIGTKNEFNVIVPPPEFTGDNAAMIALAGYFNYKKGKKYDWQKVEANANWEIV